MSIDVKICGLKTPEAIAAAVEGGAKMLGFVFFEKSPRNVTRDTARALLEHVPEGVTKVALLVNPSDDAARIIARDLTFDMVQLHGPENPARVAEIKAITELAVMKAMGIAGVDDIARAHDYEGVADRILLDAKPPENAALPGGNALSFDWNLIAGENWKKPWMLAGGLNAQNLAEAVKTSGATFVDVSSGVEDAPGRKSSAKIREFLELAQSL